MHAICLHSPLIGMEGLRQFHVAQMPDGLEILIAVQPGLDADVLKSKTEQTIRSVLEKLGVGHLRIEVTEVNEITRVGSGAKMKLTTKPMQN